MKKILAVIFWLILFIPAQAQYWNYDLTLMRGDARTLRFEHHRNLTAERLEFVIKKDTSFSSDRLVWKKNQFAGGDTNQIECVFKVTKSYIYIYLKQIDTEDLQFNVLVYNLISAPVSDSTNETTLYAGRIFLKPDVLTNFDGVNTPPAGTRFFYAPLDSSDKQPGVAIFYDSNNSMDYLSYAQLKDSLGTTSSQSEFVLIAANDSPQKMKDAADYVCDGVNDQVEFNNAIQTKYFTALGGTKRIVIHVAEGTYDIRDSIKIDKQVTIVGSGMNRTMLIRNANFYTGNVFAVNDSLTGFIFEMIDIKLFSNPYNLSSGNGSGVVVRNYSEIVIRNCEINGFLGNGAGIKFDSKNDWYGLWNDIRDSWFYLNGKNILVSNASGTYPVQDIIISGCHFAGTNEAGITPDPPSIVVTTNSKLRHVTISNNHIRNGGLLFNSGDIFTITGNTFNAKSGTTYGIKFGNRGSSTNLNALVSENNFHNATGGNYIAGTYDTLIYIGTNCDNVDVVNNRLYGELTSKVYTVSGANLNGFVRFNTPVTVNTEFTPNEIQTSGQVDEYVLTYESSTSDFEWQPDATGGGGSGLFELDGSGDLMPNDETLPDTFFELDGNGDIQPL